MVDTSNSRQEPRADLAGLRNGFRALADGTRRSILELLSEQPRGVSELAERFPEMSRPAVSKHLRILREAGLAKETKQGRERIYRLETGALAKVVEWLGDLETQRAERASAAVPRPSQPTTAVAGRIQGRSAAPDRRARPLPDNGPGPPRAEPASVGRPQSERATKEEEADELEIGPEESGSTLVVDWRSW